MVHDKRIIAFNEAFASLISFMQAQTLPRDLMSKVLIMSGAFVGGSKLNPIKLPGELYYRVVLVDTISDPIKNRDVAFITSNAYTDVIRQAMHPDECASLGANEDAIGDLLGSMQAFLRKQTVAATEQFFDLLIEVLFCAIEVFETAPAIVYHVKTRAQTAVVPAVEKPETVVAPAVEKPETVVSAAAVSPKPETVGSAADAANVPTPPTKRRRV